MNRLSTSELALIDKIFGIYSGQVLNFSNRTFERFFLKDLGVDIYGDQYALHGNSKGKRFLAFLEMAPASLIAKALSALWEIREIERLDGEEVPTIVDGYLRLSELIVKLGGKPLVDRPTSGTAPASQRVPAVAEQTELDQLFSELLNADDTPQLRGYLFERFLKRWFNVWGLDARGSFKLVGEQIDGSFEHRGAVYLIEAKWTNARTPAADLRSFQEKVGDGFEGTRGLFISYAGFTPDALSAFNSKRVILMNGLDVSDALTRRLSLEAIVAAKYRRGTEERRAWIAVRELFP